MDLSAAILHDDAQVATFEVHVKVIRSSSNAQLATFANGKQYNADLNGSLNIAARGIAMILAEKLKSWQEKISKNKSEIGKSSDSEVRMPLVLADIWEYAQSVRPALCGNDNRLRVS